MKAYKINIHSNLMDNYHLANISACRHCSSFHEIREELGLVYCVNKESPFYRENFERPMRLIFETLPGCNHFILKEKIPQDIYRYLPSDSPIRKLPPEQAISDYTGSQKLMSTKTTRRVLDEIRKRKPSEVIKEMIPKD
jgi:hypothetical protein